MSAKRRAISEPFRARADARGYRACRLSHFRKCDKVKTGERRELNRSLAYFQKATGAQYAFQVAVNAAYTDADCFAETAPVRVPAATLLSQLV
jgi:hypothetical protein